MSSKSEDDREFKELPIDDPAVAKARSVKKLSGGDKEASNKRVLSNLANDSQVFRLSAMYMIAETMPNYFGFLKDVADNELELRASLPRKKGKRGRDDVVDVSREPSVEGGGGVFGKLRDSFVSR